WNPEGGYKDMRLLLTLWLSQPSPAHYTAIQLLGAAACALTCLVTRVVAWPERRSLTLLLAMGCCWMTVLGPSTESCTYNLLAPTMAWALMEVWLEPSPLALRLLLLGSYVMFLSTTVAAWFPGGTRAIHTLGIHPLAALLLLAGVIWQELFFFKKARMPRAAVGGRARTWAARAALRFRLPLYGIMCWPFVGGRGM